MTIKAWIAAAVATLAVSAAPGAMADNIYRGEKTVGLAAGFHSCNRSAVAGIEFTYRFSAHFRLAPSVAYVFRHHDKDALVLNVNAQVPFQVSDRCDIYPFAGVNYSSWNRHGDLRRLDESHDVGYRTTRLGLNAGAGANFNVSASLRLSITAGYSFVKDHGGALALAGIAYRF